MSQELTIYGTKFKPVYTELEPIEIMYIDLFIIDIESKITSRKRLIILPYINEYDFMVNEKSIVITRIDFFTQNKFFLSLRTYENKIVHYKESVVIKDLRLYTGGFIRNMEFGNYKTYFIKNKNPETGEETERMIQEELIFGVEIPINETKGDHFEHLNRLDCVRSVDYMEYCTTIPRYINLLNSYTNANDKNTPILDSLKNEISDIKDTFDVEDLDELRKVVAQTKRIETIATKNEDQVTIYTFLCIALLIFIYWYYTTQFV